MAGTLSRALKLGLNGVLIAALAGCGTIMYPQRRGQIGGRVDPGVALLDTVGLLFFIVPGVIAFAVDISDGCIYLPARPWPRRQYAPPPPGYSPQPGYGPGGYPPPPPPYSPLQGMNLRRVPLRPGHEDAAAIQKLIQQETGLTVSFHDPAMQVRRLHSLQEMAADFAASPERPLAFAQEPSSARGDTR